MIGFFKKILLSQSGGIAVSDDSPSRQDVQVGSNAKPPVDWLVDSMGRVTPPSRSPDSQIAVADWLQPLLAAKGGLPAPHSETKLVLPSGAQSIEPTPELPAVIEPALAAAVPQEKVLGKVPRGKGFSMPKIGEAEVSCQDSFGAKVAANGSTWIAICDGVTANSSKSRSWADKLVSSFVTAPPALDGTVESVQMNMALWQASTGGSFEASPSKKPAAGGWLATGLAKQGSLSTFLGLQLLPTSAETGTAKYRAVAVGDTNLFHVRRGKLLTAFPLDHAAEFGAVTTALHSKTPADPGAFKVLGEGEAKPGDVFYLMTDAMAKYVLSEAEGRSPWSRLGAVKSRRDFESFVKHARERGMDDDDSTLVSFTVRAAPGTGRALRHKKHRAAPNPFAAKPTQ